MHFISSPAADIFITCYSTDVLNTCTLHFVACNRRITHMYTDVLQTCTLHFVTRNWRIKYICTFFRHLQLAYYIHTSCIPAINDMHKQCRGHVYIYKCSMHTLTDIISVHVYIHRRYFWQLSMICTSSVVVRCPRMMFLTVNPPLSLLHHTYGMSQCYVYDFIWHVPYDILQNDICSVTLHNT